MFRKRNFITGGSTDSDSEQKFLINKVKVLPGSDKNVISISFFTFDGSYKPLEIYIEGLSLIENIIKQNRTKYNIILRVYYDYSIKNSTNQKIKDLMKQLEESPITELFYVDISPLIEPSQSMLLTVIFRYLPLFDLPDNDCKYAYILDCDLSYFKKNDIKQVKYSIDEFVFMIEKNADIKFRMPLCYVPFWAAKLRHRSDIGITLGAYMGGKANILPTKLLTRFLNSFMIKNDKLINKFLDNYLDYINENLAKKGDDEKFLKKKNSCVNGKCIYVYGFDEFFLNFYLLPWCCKNIKKVCLHSTMSMGGLNVLFRTTFIEKGSKPKLTAFLHEFASKYNFQKVNKMTFDQFIGMYENHDYEGKDKEKIKIYEKFNEYCRKNEKTLSKQRLVDYVSFKCFKEHKIYLTDHNNFKCLNDTEKNRVVMYINNVIKLVNNHGEK